jgi:hypothetical protein
MPRRDSSTGGRLILAAVVAVYFVVQYLATRELDDVTGETHQFAHSVEQEIAMGKAAAPKFRRENGGEVIGRAADILRRLGSTVVVRNSVAARSA